MSVQDMHERLKKANERRNCGADEEIARLRAEVEILVWNLAGISTLACSRTSTDYNREMARPALNDVAELVKDYARLRAANAELSVTIQKLRKALTYYAEQEYNPSRADDGVIAREALR